MTFKALITDMWILLPSSSRTRSKRSRVLAPDVFVEKASSVEVGRSLASQFLLLSVEGADGNEPKTTTV